MPCILCLKADELILSTAMQIFSDEANKLDIQGILKQHFWVQPKEDDIYTSVCGECWKYLIEFHKFYIQIMELHQCKGLTNFESSIFSELDKIKIEHKDDHLELSLDSSELRQCDPALEEYPIEATAPDEALSEDALSYSVEETYRITRKTNWQKTEAMTNGKKTVDKLSKAKTRRGRPPKNEAIEAKEQATSINNEKIEEMELLEKCELPKQKTRRGRPPKKEELKKTKNKNQSKGTRGATIKKIISRRDLSQYDNFISENIKLNCAVCKEECENFTTLQAHFRKAHEMRGYVVCCGKKLLKRGVLVDHLYTHKDPEYFKCTTCNKVLADRRCLELHQQTHQEKGEPTFKCEICSKAFHLRTVYKLHVDSHVPQELRKFECTHCAKRYASKYLLNNHVQLVHLNKYSRVCDICGKKIIGSEAFRVHQEQHKGVKQELINCDICGATVKTKYDLTRHKKIKHTEEYQTPQQCKYCSKISPNMMALYRHIQYMHNLQRNHKCSMCEKSFKRSKDLKEHFSTHTGDVLYVCTFCPRTFNSNANMYAHRKKKHPQEWALTRKEKAAKPLTPASLI